MIIKCRICKTDKTKIISRVSIYKLFKCLCCRVIFVSPQSNLAKVEMNNLIRYDSKDSIEQYFNMQNIFLRRAEYCIEILKKYKSLGYLLDIGCSFGFYLRIFDQNRYKTLGIDISAKAVRFINSKSGLKAVVGKFDTYKFKDNNFDIVTIFDVLEHFSNPQEIIAKIRRILKKDGIVIIQTPNFYSIMSRMTGLNWFWLLVPQHLFLYSLNTIKYLLKNNGFKILHISTWDDYHEFMNNVLMLFGIRYSGKTAFLHRILVKLKYVLIPISYLWNIFYLGGELLVYAQKE